MRKLFIVIFSWLIINPVFAQIKMGIKVSPQYTWTSTDGKSVTTPNSKANISYGLVLDYFFSENYSIGTEFSIGTFAGSIRPDSIVYIKEIGKTVSDLQLDYRLQYINVPLILKMRTKEIGYLRYYAEFGLGMSYNFKAKADITSSQTIHTDVDVNNPDPADKLTFQDRNSSGNVLSQKVNFFRASLIMGAGIQYNVFGNSMLVVGFRYDNALTNFTDEPTWKANMSFVALHLGIMF